MVKGKQAWVTAQAAGSKIASADFHGAKLCVVRSKCVSLVGLKGIVVRDTKFTFQIITERNELKSTWISLRKAGLMANETSSSSQKPHRFPVSATAA